MLATSSSLKHNLNVLDFFFLLPLAGGTHYKYKYVCVYKNFVCIYNFVNIHIRIFYLALDFCTS